MLTIDGAMGEGGGQVLRTSLALSALTATPFRIEGIRAKRRKPGLMRQHLTCVRAAAEICGAEVTGDALRSQALTFRPGALRPGEHRFSVGTAGSANLVLQTVLPPLLLADAPSLLTLEGGTHNAKSPPYHFVAEVFAPLIGRMGPAVALSLDRWGFYPAGGGAMTAHIEPASALSPLTLLERGAVEAIRPRAVVANLSPNIGHREVKAVCDALAIPRRDGRVTVVEESRGPGNALMVEVECAHARELFTGFGERGVSAERVARGVALEAMAWIDADVPVGEFLADQLLIPLALAGGGAFRTTAASLHTRTNAEVIRRFLDVSFTFTRESELAWRVEVG